MKKEELLIKLKELIVKSEIYAFSPFKVDGDPSDWHQIADNLLLAYIDDQEIDDAFNKIERWYD